MRGSRGNKRNDAVASRGPRALKPGARCTSCGRGRSARRGRCSLGQVVRGRRRGRARAGRLAGRRRRPRAPLGRAGRSARRCGQRARPRPPAGCGRQTIDRITPVRVGGETEPGLDEAMHGENASHKRDRLTAHPACTLGRGMFEPFDPTLIGRDRQIKISRMRCRSHRGFRSNRE
jgi:hypothetical protein